MKIQLTTLFIIFSFITCFGQIDTTKVPVISYWSKGDSYDFKVTKIKQKWNEGNLTENDSSSYIVNFEVIDSTETGYKIKWKHKTNFTGLLIPVELTRALSKYAMTEIIYTTNEVGEFMGVENWEEIAAMVKEMFVSMIDLAAAEEEINEKDLAQIIQPLMNIYETREGIEQLLFKELHYFHFPFGAEFTPSETITYEDELPNMLGGDPIRGNTKIYFDDVNFEESHCVIMYEMDLNPDDTKNLLAAFFKQMKLDDKEMDEAMKTARFEIKDRNRYEYYYYPGIPVNIDVKRESLMDFGVEKGKAVENIRIEWLGQDDYQKSLRQYSTKEDWKTEDYINSTQILLSNDYQLNTSSSRGASAFLIEAKGDTVLCTAKHLLGEDMGIEPEISTKDFNAALKYWKTFPRKNDLSNDTIYVTKLINEEINPIDIILQECTLGEKNNIQVLKPRLSKVRRGEKLEIIGCEYADRNCFQRKYDAIVDGYDEDGDLWIESSEKINLRGFSGAPVIDSNGFVIGVIYGGDESVIVTPITKVANHLR